MSIMPKLPFDLMVADCTEDEARIIRAACNSRTGCLRATKPFGRIDFHGDKDEALFRACANYVWRMLCFDFVEHRPHSCMPCTADFDIGAVYHLREKHGDYSDRDERFRAERVLRDSLDVLIKQAEAVLPITAQKGAMAWGRAFGIV
jgi:hypothetical protein